MGPFDQLPRRHMGTPIIFVVEASSSMAGERINGVNRTLANIVNKLVEKIRVGKMATATYAVLRFSSEAEWLTDGLVSPEYEPFPTITAEGTADIGRALEQIDQKLSRSGFLGEGEYFKPLICFITCGTQGNDYSEPLKRLKKNAWYRLAMKFALLIGDGADRELMTEICDNPEHILASDDVTEFESFIEPYLRIITLGVAVSGSDDVFDIDSMEDLARSVSKSTYWDSGIQCQRETRDIKTPHPDAATDFFSLEEASACIEEPHGNGSSVTQGTTESTTKARGTSASTTVTQGTTESTTKARGTSASTTVTQGTSASTTVTQGTSASTTVTQGTTESTTKARGTSVSTTVTQGTTESTTKARGTSASTTVPSPRGTQDGGDVGTLRSSEPETDCEPDSAEGSPLRRIVGELFGGFVGAVPSGGMLSRLPTLWSKHMKKDKPEAKTTKAECLNVSRVQFSATVPKRFVKGEYSMINITVYEDEYRHIVDKLIADADSEVKEVVGGSRNITENTMIRISLSSPDIEIFDCDETQKWEGRYLTYGFPIEIPNNYAKKQALFVASVYFNDVIATKLKFVVNCTSTMEQKLQLTREDIIKAFISYASQDRARVATIIQGMQKARPDMDIFFDVESLRSGDDWEKALRREIENRDVLFLCWSKFAKESKWVDIEWRYALNLKGIDSIEPIPLVSPSECPPPAELNSKHFNDRALLYNKE